jgi:hypothetical protein
MATDVDRLRAGLEEYRASLGRHLARLSRDYEQVQHCWRALDQEYEGRAAEEFRQRWRKTSEWFKDYESALRTMIAMLETRSQELRGL